MKRLTLLSGGEKSMTAIAFLFAVFLARPCPFYILDEVEAALDDLNITRFLDLLRTYRDRAQFIVVTHQKRTMEAADTLYGVSMGDDGVSKVVSRRLPQEVAEEPGRAAGRRGVAPGRVASAPPGARGWAGCPSQTTSSPAAASSAPPPAPWGRPPSGAPPGRWPDRPRRAPFEHVVVLMMENRSFDHFLGWLPGADGRQAGLSLPRPRRRAATRRTRWRPTSRAAGTPIPTTPTRAGASSTTAAACDGWLRAGDNDALRHRLLHASATSPSWAGRRRSGRRSTATSPRSWPRRTRTASTSTPRQTDRLDNTFDDLARCRRSGTAWPTPGSSGRYYFSDVPFLALWGGKYVPDQPPDRRRSSPTARPGTCPRCRSSTRASSDEEAGTSGDDHPHADIRNGEAFLNRDLPAVTHEPGLGAHRAGHQLRRVGRLLRPRAAAHAPTAARDARGGRRGRAARIPGAAACSVSPWARRGYVVARQFDHTSVLRMIEWRWGLAPLTVRDETANNLADELLPFTPAPPGAAVRRSRRGRSAAPARPRRRPPAGRAASAARRGTGGARGLRELARSAGWKVH